MNSQINRQYNDRLFSFLFANHKHKNYTLDLYNAVNGTAYDNPDDISFDMLDDVIYIGMRNDISFLLHHELNLYEHQSTFNPNMPLRDLFYVSHIFEQYINEKQKSIFSTRLIEIPNPKFVVFYNGDKKVDEEVTMKLSDAYGKTDDIQLELKVRMINIGYDMHSQVLEKCQPLKEYSYFVDNVKKGVRFGKRLEDSVGDAIMKMPKNFEIYNLLNEHKT